MKINQNIDDFLEIYFGESYTKELSINNYRKISSLHENLLGMKEDINFFLKFDDNIPNDSKENLLRIINNYFNNNPNKISDKQDSFSIEVKKETDSYNMPIMTLATSCYHFNINMGWWTDIQTGKPLTRNRKEIVSLIASEITEALSYLRTKGKKDKHLPHRNGLDVELADAIIRIMDYCGRYKINFMFNFLEIANKNSHNNMIKTIDELSNLIEDKDYQQYIEKLNQIDFHTNIDTLGQFEAYHKFCKNKTSISNIDNDFEALLKILNKITSISDLEISGDEDYRTHDDIIESDTLSESLAMILDFAAIKEINLTEIIVEKILYNYRREDHQKENRLKPHGKIN